MSIQALIYEYEKQANKARCRPVFLCKIVFDFLV